ncbi:MULTISPECIES: hypothetical protein [Methanosarcina]|uniref:Uncharacterized protein n=8 Tax=Methanosarcina mazei TaxID=2209 RepID=A0A0F8PIF7_METMZ|nr:MULTISPECIES: hypothetical protein [Methanosarcina]AAM30943.1 conserved protein [Methanosarcina mazei Go1]AGF96674.1 hypothetical protein MmTuc01_1290 [Methanosarcina mazei Tuc01]AKB39060.1 hypothetical protein MSMAW_0069 [Methanosarcina mazei WWM610]AKB60052.1 hypothetical protein MSMAP_0067 [Methanosarcina mazei SarPi]AKB63262.1 hypothetical protein MSMAS_0066 [Methanosarcina mazei S-6]
MKAEKREQMEKMRAYKKVREQNKKTTLISLSILATGMVLTTLEIDLLGIDIGYYLMWAGVFVFFVVSIQGLFAAGSLRKQR